MPTLFPEGSTSSRFSPPHAPIVESVALDRASETVDAALAQCSDVDQYLPALLRKLTTIGSFLRFRLRYTPKSFAVTFMPGGPCATVCPRRDVVKLNANADTNTGTNTGTNARPSTGASALSRHRSR